MVKADKLSEKKGLFILSYSFLTIEGKLQTSKIRSNTSKGIKLQFAQVCKDYIIIYLESHGVRKYGLHDMSFSRFIREMEDSERYIYNKLKEPIHFTWTLDLLILTIKKLNKDATIIHNTHRQSA